MSAGRVDCVVNALVLGLTAIAKNPNLGTYKILQTPSVAIASSMAVRREPDKRWRDFLSVWVDYNRGIGQMREWFVKGCRCRRQARRRAGRTQYLKASSLTLR